MAACRYLDECLYSLLELAATVDEYVERLRSHEELSQHLPKVDVRALEAPYQRASELYKPLLSAEEWHPLERDQWKEVDGENAFHVEVSDECPGFLRFVSDSYPPLNLYQRLCGLKRAIGRNVANRKEGSQPPVYSLFIHVQNYDNETFTCGAQLSLPFLSSTALFAIVFHSC